jgi:leader peptidase (prepilin peptidase)/N-methyltransferase
VQLDLFLSPAALGVLGLAIGSFLNVVIHRLPLMLERQWWEESVSLLGDRESWRRVFASKSEPPAAHGETVDTLGKAIEALPAFDLAKPRSRCPECGHVIAWHENIPLLAWLRLRGRCSACGTRIPTRYPLVELATALLFAAIGWRFGASPIALLWCGAVAALIALALIDWDTTWLPDALTQPLLWAGLIAAAFGWTIPLPDALWGAVAGYLSLWTVYWLFKQVTRKEGMGYGDFKLLAVLGAWLGWKMIVPIVLMASVIGAIVGIAMKIRGALREGGYVPFGPFLVGGGLVVILVGTPTVLHWLRWA